MWLVKLSDHILITLKWNIADKYFTIQNIKQKQITQICVLPPRDVATHNSFTFSAISKADGGKNNPENV